MLSARIPRLVRGAIAAAVATFVALFAHVVAGGPMPAAVGILVPLVLSISACTLLAGRRLSLIRLTASVGVAQLLFHTLFVLGSGSSGRVVPATHHVDPAVTASILDAESTVHTHGDAGMWIGHAVAAAVTVGVLYLGERILLALTALDARVESWIRRLIDALIRPVPPVFLRRLVVALSGSRSLVAGVRLHSASRRGPPVLSV